MTAGTARTEDAFGFDRRTRLSRRLVAAAVAAAGFATAFSVFFIAASATWAVVLVHVLVVPASVVLERRWPGRPGRPSLARYGLVGAVLGPVTLVVVLLALPTPGWAVLAGAVGAVATSLGVRIAASVPARWVAPVGVLGVVAILGIAVLS